MPFDAAAAGPDSALCSVAWMVSHVAVTGSTNDDLIVAARAGAAEGAVLVADHQTCGRGRADRRWLGRRGQDLLFSVLLRPDIAGPHYGLLSLAAGVAVADALTELTGARFALKWPNDVLAPPHSPVARGGKVSGILLDANTQACYAVIGIGVNLSGEPPAIGAGRVTASVEQVTGRLLTREPVVAAVLARLDLLYRHLKGDGPGPIVDACNRLDALRGCAVRLTTPSGPLQGTAAGVDELGRLLIDTPTGTIGADSGEAHLLQ